jgi:hypothetical protein
MADASKIKMGVCSVTFDGTDLGHTKGGVVVTYEPDIHETVVDRYGSTPVEMTLIGERLSAKVPLAEWAIATLQAIIPTASAGTTKTTLGGQVGDKLGALGGLLVLHPIANAVGTRTEDVVIYKAVPMSPVEMKFMVDDERVMEVEFVGLIDETKADGTMLGLIGDSAGA